MRSGSAPQTSAAGHVVHRARPEPARIQRHAAPDRPGSGARRASAQHDSAGVDPADPVRPAAARLRGRPTARCASTSSAASASRRSCGARAGAGCRNRSRASTPKRSSTRSRRRHAPVGQAVRRETWVWGAGVSGATLPKLMAQVTDLYERNYTNAWDALLNDLEIVPFSTVRAVRRRAGDPWPDRPRRCAACCSIVVDNTTFVRRQPRPTAGAGINTLSRDRITQGSRRTSQLGGKDDHADRRASQPGTVDHASTSSRSTGSWPGPRRRSMASSNRCARFATSLLRSVRRRAATDPLTRAHRSGVARPQARLAARSRRICRRRSTSWWPQIAQLRPAQRQRGRDGSSSSDSIGTGRRGACRVRVEGRYPFGSRAATMSAGRLRRRVRARRAVRQVLHRQARQAGRHVAAPVDVASGVRATRRPFRSVEFERGGATFVRCSSRRARRRRSSRSS